MAAKLQELKITYMGERFRFANVDGDVVIADAWLDDAEALEGGRIVTIKGQAEADELVRDLSYLLYGRWSNYKNRRTGQDERQFHFQSFVECRPHSREGIIGYLAKQGEGLGVGKARASQLWQVFNSAAIRVCRGSPQTAAAAIQGWSVELAEKLAARLKESEHLETSTVELTELLAGRGFPQSVVRLAIKEWGSRASAVVRENPYLAMQFRGCGFALCDKLYVSLGLPLDAMLRQALCAWYAVASNTDGNTWFPGQWVIRQVELAIGAGAKPLEALKMARDLGRDDPDAIGALALVGTRDNALCDSDPDAIWVAEGRKAWCERRIAELAVQAMQEAEVHDVPVYQEIFDRPLPEAALCGHCSLPIFEPMVRMVGEQGFHADCLLQVEDFHLKKQKHVSRNFFLAAHGCEDASIATVQAGWNSWQERSLWPGASLIEGIDAHQVGELAKAFAGGPLAILGGSPGTGKTYSAAAAIKCMAETIGLHNIAVAAPTGKAAVRISEALAENGVPLVARTWHSLLGVDPASVGGGWSFAHNESQPLPYKVLVGDESSMLDASLMSAILRARGTGTHLLLIGDINQLPPVGHGAPLRDLIAAGVPYGELTEIKRASGGIVETCAAIRDGKSWQPGDNLRLHARGKPDDQIQAMLDLLAEARRDGLDPVWDCQVIVAVNEKGPLNRKLLNDTLQAELNGNERQGRFAVGDKVVNTSNKMFQLDGQEDETFAANGELGRVAEIDGRVLKVDLDGPPRTIRVPLGAGDDGGCSWELGYALSCHKSQGSEWPRVLVMLDDYPGARRVCSREWLYTAISRARQRCELIGQKGVADAMCRRVALGKRKTFLAEHIRKLRAERVLEGMI